MIQFKNLQQFSKTVRWRGWDALSVERGDVALVFAPQLGGRVIGCAYKGKELFFTDPACEGEVPPFPGSVEEMLRVKRERGFRLYGGSKTWLSPQEAWPDALPYYDLDSGPWSLTQSSSRTEAVVKLESPACRESGVQIAKEFTLADNSSVKIRYTITNGSTRAVRYGLWDVTQLDRPGTVFMPVSPTSKFETGVKIFDVESPDPKAALKKLSVQSGCARIECDDSTRFKFGGDSDAGWLVGFVPWEKSRWVVFKKRFHTLPGAPFGHGCSVEVFNSDLTANFEMEIHGPVVTLKPGESSKWESSWHFSEAFRLPQSLEDLSVFVH